MNKQSKNNAILQMSRPDFAFEKFAVSFRYSKSRLLISLQKTERFPI